jgi:hypothetical protein
MSVVTITITDPALLAQLEKADGPIVFLGPDGRQVRWAEAVPPERFPAGLRPPMSDEELERRRKSPVSGITLAEFFEKLERGEGR